MKVEFYRQIFEKSSNIKFHENRSTGSRVVPCGRKDRHDQANSLRTRLKSERLASFQSISHQWRINTIFLCSFLPC